MSNAELLLATVHRLLAAIEACQRVTRPWLHWASGEGGWLATLQMDRGQVTDFMQRWHAVLLAAEDVQRAVRGEALT